MLRTANQRIAALVLVGGVVAFASLLLLAFTIPLMHFDLVMVWDLANSLVLSKLINGDFYEIDPFLEQYTYTAIVTIAALILSYLLGLLLALRTLLKDWREVRRLRIIFTLNRLVAVLILLGGVITIGCLLWYMDLCNAGLVFAWNNFNFIFTSQISEAIDYPLRYFDQTIIRAANVVMAALAFSYVLSLALAVWTLWQRWRAPIGTTE